MKQLLDPAQIALATRLWSDGVPLDGVCAALGIGRDVLIERRRPGDQLAHLGRRQRGVNSQATREPDPDPATIAARAAAIRATWSPVERLNRRAGPGALVDSWVGERKGGRGATFRMPRRTW